MTEEFYIERFRLGSGFMAYVPETKQGVKRYRPKGDRSLAGPVPMARVHAADNLGKRVLLVGLVVWHKRGMRKTPSVALTTKDVKRYGIDRQTKYRALRKLEDAKLISVERQGNQSPRVTLLEAPTR
jgi:hypothetical protein